MEKCSLKIEKSLTKIDLDALIPREDFEVTDEQGFDIGRMMNAIKSTDLKQGSLFFSVIRKPDFQRETNEWDDDKIVSLIESFLDGDLIPAIILWRNSAGSYTFVLDGAHRLSALAAWVNDDYGDGVISQAFYGPQISDAQIEVGKRVRNNIVKKIGTYRDYEIAAQRIDQVKDGLIKRRASNLGIIAMQVQWVAGDAQKAEHSFHKINLSATPINDTELRLLQSRRKPHAIASRAIIRSGKGHKYWSKFDQDNQKIIETLASEINAVFFEPELKTPIRTLDLPIGGKAKSARSLPMVLEFVDIVNQIKSDNDLKDDLDGKQTIECIKKTKKMIDRINSNHPSSLGLHPAIYFYSKDGQHKPTSLYAVASFIMELETHNALDDFIKVRQQFENLLKDHDYVIQQIWRHYRGGTRAYEHIKDFYLEVMKRCSSEKTNEQIIDEISQSKEFDYVLRQTEVREGTAGADFTKATKSAAFIRDALQRALRCEICGGLIHVNATSIDHEVRKSDGGTNSVTNAQLTHPYCNTTYKN
ncbi:MAG: DUF262 domain-containing protein [Thaumarchaeota archaeon]|nr:DUF262 domain-containing protein [Nitrososphaerota archaeon]